MVRQGDGERACRTTEHPAASAPAEPLLSTADIPEAEAVAEPDPGRGGRQGGLLGVEQQARHDCAAESASRVATNGMVATGPVIIVSAHDSRCPVANP